MNKILALCALIPFIGFGQEFNTKGNQGGTFALGMRTTFSTFNSHHEEGNGIGAGGQFRLQFADRVNSDWFFDYIKSDIGDYASRTDYHIGWSVVFYLRNDKNAKIQPYALAGHCFDYTYMSANNDRNNYNERWSSAVQGGLGMQFSLSSRFNLTVTGQYMLHLGNEVGAENHNGVVDFHEESGSSMEGHMLFNIGLNYKIVDLW